MRSVKCVVVGDGAIGKACLLETYITRIFPSEYTPHVFENYSKTVMVDEEAIDLHLWYTAGQEDYDRLRPLSYQGTNCFLVCFSLVSPCSFENVERKWVPEIRRYRPDTPIILVGLQLDLRDEEKELNRLSDYGKFPITAIQGRKMAKKIKASKYLECSALKNIAVDDVFQEVVRVELSKVKSKNCTII